jgi:hypothetical protein
MMLNRLKINDWLAVVIYPLAVVLMEAFWVYPWLVWFGVWPLFTESRPALSLISVIIVLAVSLLVTRVSIRQKWPLRLIQCVVIGCGLVTMFLVLRFDYAGGYGFFNGQWYVHMGQVLGATFDRPHIVVLALPILIYLWWRGILLGRTTSYFSNIYRSFVIGIVALIVLIIFWQLSASSGNLEGPVATIGWYIVAFFFFGLIAVAICHLYVMRRRMPREETVVTSVWRWLPIMLGVIGGMVVIGLGVASVFSAEFFASIERGAKAVFDALGTAFYYILIPFNYLFEGIYFIVQLIINLLRQGQEPKFEVTGNMTLTDMPEVIPKDIPPIVTTILQWLVVAVIVAVVVYILAKAIERFRERRREEEIEEIHESLWSLSGLRDDLILLFNMMANKFKRRPAPASEKYHFREDALGRLDIREIYRHLLWEGARSGVARRAHETTCEYAERLERVVPQGSGQLAEITDLYASVRYGETKPQEEQVDSANSLWKTLRNMLRGLRGD